jgi:hypothetical protein
VPCCQSHSVCTLAFRGEALCLHHTKTVIAVLLLLLLLWCCCLCVSMCPPAQTPSIACIEMMQCVAQGIPVSGES